MLAVLTILAIILLIAIPMLGNVIKNSREKANEDSVNLYGRAIENAINEYYVKYPLKNEVTLKELEDENLIKYEGNKVECNVVQIEDRDVYLADCKVGNKYVDATYGEQILATADDYRGYYADVDGDGNPDGIIYADLGANIEYPQSGQWGNSDGTYTYNKATGELNEYTVSNNTYKKNDGFGENKIIKLKKDKNNPRFYVMALEDFTTEAYTDPNDSNNNYPAYTTYYWYKEAYGDMSPLITETEFGSGKENTRKMIAKWDAAGTAEGYPNSPQNNQDIWKHIKDKYNSEKWYIPSRGEWAAFGDYFSSKEENPLTHDYESGSPIENSGNYSSFYGLSPYYWSSSQRDADYAWRAYFTNGVVFDFVVNNLYCVRLGATF